jgi:hypothetical protein
LNNQAISLLSLPCAILKVDHMGASKYSASRGYDIQASTVLDVSKPNVYSIVSATVLHISATLLYHTNYKQFRRI